MTPFEGYPPQSTAADLATTLPPPPVSPTTRHYAYMLKISAPVTVLFTLAFLAFGVRSEIGVLMLGWTASGALGVYFGINGLFFNGDVRDAQAAIKKAADLGCAMPYPHYHGRAYSSPSSGRREALIILWASVALISIDLVAYYWFCRWPNNVTMRTALLFILPCLFGWTTLCGICRLHPSTHGKDLAQDIAKGLVS